MGDRRPADPTVSPAELADKFFLPIELAIAIPSN
jgi:hypothetical protein